MNNFFKSIRKFAATGIAALCMTQGVWADTGAAIAAYINSLHQAGDLVATFSPGNNTVTVNGAVGAAPSTANYLTFNIDAGLTIIWEATLAGNPSGTFSLIYISGGSGTFEMRSGGINNTGAGRAITNNSACAVNILGGTVSAATGVAIYNASTGALNISDATVSATTGNAIHNNSTGVITVSGNATRITSANTSNGTIYLANSGTATAARLIITGGTVENTANSTSVSAIYNNSRELWARWTQITSSSELFAPNLKIFPNPFTSVVRITGAEGCTLQVITEAGAIVHTQKITNPDETLRLEYLPAGVYFFRVEKDGKTKTVKMAKE